VNPVSPGSSRQTLVLLLVETVFLVNSVIFKLLSVALSVHRANILGATTLFRAQPVASVPIPMLLALPFVRIVRLLPTKIKSTPSHVKSASPVHFLLLPLLKFVPRVWREHISLNLDRPLVSNRPLVTLLSATLAFPSSLVPSALTKMNRVDRSVELVFQGNSKTPPVILLVHPVVLLRSQIAVHLNAPPASTVSTILTAIWELVWLALLVKFRLRLRVNWIVLIVQSATTPLLMVSLLVFPVKREPIKIFLANLSVLIALLVRIPLLSTQPNAVVALLVVLVMRKVWKNANFVLQAKFPLLRTALLFVSNALVVTTPKTRV
jgi:hypothetical protein